MAGHGVRIYILDTGIRLSHGWFNNGYRSAKNFKDATTSPYCDDNESMEDFVRIGGIIPFLFRTVSGDSPKKNPTSPERCCFE